MPHRSGLSCNHPNVISILYIDTNMNFYTVDSREIIQKRKVDFLQINDYRRQNQGN